MVASQIFATKLEFAVLQSWVPLGVLYILLRALAEY